MTGVLFNVFAALKQSGPDFALKLPPVSGHKTASCSCAEHLWVVFGTFCLRNMFIFLMEGEIKKKTLILVSEKCRSIFSAEYHSNPY